MLTFAYIISIICIAFITVEDFRKRLIPDVWLWPLFLSGLFLFHDRAEHVAAAILGYAIGFLLLWAMRWYKKDALGLGDIKLLSAAGLWLGIDGLSRAVIFACVIGIVYGLIRKQRFIPFAPFLFAGAGIYLLTQMVITNY